MRAVPLASAVEESSFGGKAVALGAALRAGFPVPRGMALDVELVEAVGRGEAAASGKLERAFRRIGAPLAIRSSAVGEDSAGASFAGQHLTVLNVTTWDEVAPAVQRVRDSGYTDAARAYRRRRGLDGAPRVAALLQRLVHPDRAGVLFTRDPVTGEDVRVVEATWGLGEAVVSGLVTPDAYRIARDGRVLAVEIGDKHVALRPEREGGTREEPVPPSLGRVRCLSDADLALLHALASRCEATYGPAVDLEWAFAGRELFLLQARAITTSPREAVA